MAKRKADQEPTPETPKTSRKQAASKAKPAGKQAEPKVKPAGKQPGASKAAVAKKPPAPKAKTTEKTPVASQGTAPKAVPRAKKTPTAKKTATPKAKAAETAPVAPKETVPKVSAKAPAPKQAAPLPKPRPERPILVTGGTGFVGANLVRLLVSRGEKVRVLVRQKSSSLAFKGIEDAIEKVTGDVTDYPSLLAAAQGCKQVYHVAGFVQISPFNPSYFYKINVTGTRNACEAALVAGVDKLVYTSSVAAVGYGPKEHPANEDSPYNFERFHVPYCDTKRGGEQEVLRYAREKGLNASVVNPPYMFGAWDIKPTSGALILLSAKTPVMFSIKGGMNVLDVEDAAMGHVLAMEKGRSGERYILANKAGNLTHEEVVRLILKVLKRQVPVVPLPAPVFKALGKAGDFWGNLTKSHPLLNSAAAELGCIGHYVDGSKAERELGFQAHSAEEAISRAVQWFRDNGYLT